MNDWAREFHDHETRSGMEELDEPECPYWADGKHCYIGRLYMGDGFIPHQRPIVSWAAKRCACGAKVMPRDGVSSAEG